MELENFMVTETIERKTNWDEYYEYLAEKEDEWREPDE